MHPEWVQDVEKLGKLRSWKDFKHDPKWSAAGPSQEVSWEAEQLFCANLDAADVLFIFGATSHRRKLAKNGPSN